MTDLNLKNSSMKTRSTQRSKKAQVPCNQAKIYKNNREKVDLKIVFSHFSRLQYNSNNRKLDVSAHYLLLELHSTRLKCDVGPFQTSNFACAE